MRKAFQILLVTLLLIGVRSGWAQGFMNLDFESANLTPVPAGQFGGDVSSTNAIPGWTAVVDGSQTTQILQNNLTLGAPSISIFGPSWNMGGILQGNYSVGLTAGVGGHSVSISQAGLIPISAVSILFKAAGSGGNFQVSLAGENLVYTALSTGPNYTLYGAIVPMVLAGQIETLVFSDSTIGSNYGYEDLDAIQFSPSAVPEPGVLGLFGLGGAVFAWRRRK